MVHRAGPAHEEVKLCWRNVLLAREHMAHVVWMGCCHAQCAKLCTTFELLKGFTFNGEGMALA